MDAGFSDVDFSAVDADALPTAWHDADGEREEEYEYSRDEQGDLNTPPARQEFDQLGTQPDYRKLPKRPSDIERVEDAVRRCPVPDMQPVMDCTPFEVSLEVERQWHSDSVTHNKLLGASLRTHEPDIRLFAPEFQDRRKDIL